MPAPIPRRAALGLLAGGLSPGGAAADAPAWWAFKARFLRPEGRVVDDGNEGRSHSEGQGWGLLLAVHHGDRAAFDRMLAWTRGKLRRRGDHLHAWLWRPDGQAGDGNNATDGDLFIAAGLLRGAALWSDPALAEEGRAVARDVLRLLVRRVGDLAVLLPGARGFEFPAHVVVNPSYLAFPMIADAAEAVPDPAWLRVAGDGLRLLRAARFGRWGLPPDWLAVPRDGGRPSPAPGWPARFGYDAVRVPLWLAWAGMAEEPGAAGPAAFWSGFGAGRAPAWADLSTDAVAPYEAGPGVVRIARLAGGGHGGGGAEGPGGWRNYYDAVLWLLAGMAGAERG